MITSGVHEFLGVFLLGNQQKFQNADLPKIEKKSEVQLYDNVSDLIFKRLRDFYLNIFGVFLNFQHSPLFAVGVVHPSLPGTSAALQWQSFQKVSHCVFKIDAICLLILFSFFETFLILQTYCILGNEGDITHVVCRLSVDINFVGSILRTNYSAISIQKCLTNSSNWLNYQGITYTENLSKTLKLQISVHIIMRKMCEFRDYFDVEEPNKFDRLRL